MIAGMTLTAWLVANPFFVESLGLHRIRGTSHTLRLQAMIAFIILVQGSMDFAPGNSPFEWGKAYLKGVEEP